MIQSIEFEFDSLPSSIATLNIYLKHYSKDKPTLLADPSFIDNFISAKKQRTLTGYKLLHLEAHICRFINKLTARIDMNIYQINIYFVIVGGRINTVRDPTTREPINYKS